MLSYGFIMTSHLTRFKSQSLSLIDLSMSIRPCLYFHAKKSYVQVSNIVVTFFWYRMVEISRPSHRTLKELPDITTFLTIGSLQYVSQSLGNFRCGFGTNMSTFEIILGYILCYFTPNMANCTQGLRGCWRFSL